MGTFYTFLAYAYWNIPEHGGTSHKRQNIYTSEVLVTVYVKLLLAHYYAPELCSMYHVIFYAWVG